jgi:uncharacterized protein YycO
MKLTLPRWMIEFTGHIKFSKYPMWIQYKPHLHDIKGNQVRQIIEALKPGDILLRKYSLYLNSLFTGDWGHAGLYVGDNKVIHSLGQGVIKEDILNFCRTDSICIQRIINIKSEDIAKQAIKFAEEKIGSEYDFKFELGNNKYSCTELINACYSPLFKNDYEKIMGNLVITPKGIYNSKVTESILEFRN